MPFVFAIFALLVIGVGWIMNLSALVSSDFSAQLGLSVARIIGLVIVPLGAILGYFF